MENNLFRQLCGKINYNTYNNIQKAMLMSYFGLHFTNNFILQQYPMSSYPLNVIRYTSLISFYVLTFSGGENFTKDITQIKNLYHDFIKNYNKLNHLFDLSDPIQIHTMFNYLLYKGYLSKNNEFQFSKIRLKDINCLYGTYVFTGQAFCRHISTMLTDILNDYGIQSNTLCVHYRDYDINYKIKILETPKYTKEELVNYAKTHINDEKKYDLVLEIIEKLLEENQNIEISLEKVYEKNLFKKIIGSHMISYAFKDEKSYFLDPTNNTIFRISESDEKILYDGEYEIEICPINSVFRSSRYSTNRLINQYPNVSKEEEKMMIEETMKLCNENTDIFEKFYTENADLYDEISSKVLKIKRHSFPFLS